MDFTKSQKEVIQFFLLNDNKPDIPTRITESNDISVSEKSVGTACKQLFESGILGADTTHIARRGPTPLYFLKNDIDTLRILIESFGNEKYTTVDFLMKHAAKNGDEVFTVVSKNFSIDLSQDGNIEKLIKKITTTSPSVLEYVLAERPKKEIDEKKSLFGKFLFLLGRSRGDLIGTLAFFVTLSYEDAAKYPGLAQTTEDIRMSIENFKFDLIIEENERLYRELGM